MGITWTWKPAIEKDRELPTISRTMGCCLMNRDGTLSGETSYLLGEADLEFLNGCRVAGVADAADLIEAVEKYGTIRVEGSL